MWDNPVDVFRQALFLASLMVSIIILPSLLVGLIVAVFQAATQINEQTMSFLPRLLMIFFTLVVTGGWLGRLMLDFTRSLIETLPAMIQ